MQPRHSTPNPIQIEVFKNLFAAIADEMGVVLRKSSLSPNIKERRDFSCAVFDPAAQMIAQAAHIPVHLGSMPLSVSSAVQHLNKNGRTLKPGDVIILNDPYQGGTHLPDITLVAPVFHQERLLGFVANRAHHADIGGSTPGSMAIARELYQEGLIIPPIRLVKAGQLDTEIMDMILANVRTPRERRGDLAAQLASIQRGDRRLVELFDRYGFEETIAVSDDLLDYADHVTRAFLAGIPSGIYTYEDRLDDDGISTQQIKIAVRITINGDKAVVDFSGSDPQVEGSLNAVHAITVSAVYYVFRCLLGDDVPTNAGCMRAIEVITTPGTVVSALHPAPVAGGNVETSQRIVDTLLGALSQACPDLIPAASQGTMNNLTLGGLLPGAQQSFTYYETIAGGMGGGPIAPGASAVHSHMTNTLNTPVEAIEYSIPVQVMEYRLNQGTGGTGRNPGGDGLVRSLKVLVPAHASIISERRKNQPYGLSGGKPGSPGRNTLKRGDREIPLPGKCSVDLAPGDILTILTPGGGGFGTPEGQEA